MNLVALCKLAFSVDDVPRGELPPKSLLLLLLLLLIPLLLLIFPAVTEGSRIEFLGEDMRITPTVDAILFYGRIIWREFLDFERWQDLRGKE